jgi:hypothetical protein
MYDTYPFLKGVGEDFFRVDIRKALVYIFCTDPSVQDYDEMPAVPKITVVFQKSIMVYRKDGFIMYYIIIMTTRINKQFLFSGAWGKMIHEKKPEAKNFVTLSL